MIYLDNAATTFPKPESVYSNVDFVQRNIAVNIGRGSYKVAQQAVSIVDETRYLMAELVGIDNPLNVIFTPSATLAANEIIFGIEWDEFKNVYITPFEHNAIARPLHILSKKYGFKIIQLPFDPNSHEIDIEKTIIQFTKQPPDVVFICQISNVTGTIIPVMNIAKLAKKYDARIVVDGSQSVGLIDINLYRDNIDYLIFAGHKNLYASWGVGGFVCKDECDLIPFISGGTGSNSLDLTMGDSVPQMYEPGSPNIIAISSLNTSLKWLRKTKIEVINEKKQKLIKMLIEGLKQRNCKLYLPNDLEKHTSVVSFNIDGYSANEVGVVLNQDFDIATRTGFHCAPFIHEFLKTYEWGGTVRASVGYFNTMEDIKKLLSAIDEL